MKTQKSFKVLFFSFFFSITVLAQNPIATLQQKGQTKIFYGQNSFVEAYDASNHGDTINLSIGGFTPPASIAKGITVVGAGYFPDSNVEKIQTTLMGNIFISNETDLFKITGAFVNGNIYFSNTGMIQNISISRCRFPNIYVWDNISSSINNLTIDESFIEGSIFFNTYSTIDNLLVRHCLINGLCHIPTGKNAVVDGNVFFNNQERSQSVICFGGNIRNNIFLLPSMGLDRAKNIYNNNLFLLNSFETADGSFQNNNYFGVLKEDIFIDQTGDQVNFTSDYHLKNPEKYIGTDGTQVGLYGGLTPFKEKGLPFNPQITSKSIAKETDENGNLNVTVTVKAQEN